MGEWGFLSGLFDSLQAHSPMLGRFWLLLMLVFRVVILGTVASDLFEDEQEEFACNTLQPGCKQVCYDMAFPISQYRFWVFHIVVIATPSLIFLMYAAHHHNKRESGPRSSRSRGRERQEDLHLRRLYSINVAFRILAEVGFLVGQWQLYGFKVEAQFPCSRFPCPYTVDCFTSRPAEKTVFLCFYFGVGLVALVSSSAELLYGSVKWFCLTSGGGRWGPDGEEPDCESENLHNSKLREVEEKRPGKLGSNGVKAKGASQRSNPSRKYSSVGSKGKSSLGSKGGRYVSSKMLLV